jgi:Alpha-L-arabinofuranosidase B (ABFB) domain
MFTKYLPLLATTALILSTPRASQAVCVQAENATNPIRYVHARPDGQVWLDAVGTEFQLVPHGTGVALTADNMFIRHKFGLLYLQGPDGSPYWDTDITFIREPGLTGSGWSFHVSRNKDADFFGAGYYIRHKNGRFEIAQRGGDQDFDDAAATFIEVPCHTPLPPPPPHPLVQDSRHGVLITFQSCGYPVAGLKVTCRNTASGISNDQLVGVGDTSATSCANLLYNACKATGYESRVEGDSLRIFGTNIEVDAIGPVITKKDF